MSNDSNINNERPVFTINLSICPKDVFRLLALRCLSETEQLLNDLVKNFDDIKKGITTTPRLNEPDKHFPSHEGNSEEIKNLEEMTERKLCSSRKAFFDNDFKYLGHVIDYELPLDDKRDSALGKIDLVSVTEDTLYLIEVKKVKSNEPPIRAMFEIFTFWRMLADGDGTYKTFLEKYKAHLPKEHPFELNNDPSKLNVVPAILLHENSDIAKALNLNDKQSKLINDKQSKLINLYRRFIEECGMKIFFYAYDNKNEITVEDKTDDIKKKLNSVSKT